MITDRNLSWTCKVIRKHHRCDLYLKYFPACHISLQLVLALNVWWITMFRYRRRRCCYFKHWVPQARIFELLVFLCLYNLSYTSLKLELECFVTGTGIAGRPQFSSQHSPPSQRLSTADDKQTSCLCDRGVSKFLPPVTFFSFFTCLAWRKMLQRSDTACTAGKYPTGCGLKNVYASNKCHYLKGGVAT